MEMKERDREESKAESEIEKTKWSEIKFKVKLLKQGVQTTNQNYHLALDYSHTYQQVDK